MAQMITVIRSRSPSTALEQEEQDQGGGAQARQHEFQFQPILQDPPPAAWDREQDGEERYLNSGMKSSHRSRHPTGQLESRPAAR